MELYETTRFEATPFQLERLVLLTLVGALESLRSGCLAEDDARHLLIQPSAAEALKRGGLSETSRELLLEALGLDDVRTIRPDLYQPLLDELRDKALRRLSELPPLDLQAPRWFCAEADRRAWAAFEAQSESAGTGPEEANAVRIEYRLRDDERRREKEIPFEDFYDSLEEGETFSEHGVVRHVDFREFLDAEPAAVESLRLETPHYRHSARYGDHHGLLQHTVYRDGSEMLVVQDDLEPDVTHFVKLLRERSGEWRPDDVSRLDDRTAEIVDLW